MVIVVYMTLSLHELGSICGAFLQLFFISYLVYATALHLLNIHERCRFNVILLICLATPSFIAVGYPSSPSLVNIVQPIKVVYLLTVLIGIVLLPLLWLFAKNNEQYASPMLEIESLKTPSMTEHLRHYTFYSVDGDVGDVGVSASCQTRTFSQLTPHVAVQYNTQPAEAGLISKGAFPAKADAENLSLLHQSIDKPNMAPSIGPQTKPVNIDNKRLLPEPVGRLKTANQDIAASHQKTESSKQLRPQTAVTQYDQKQLRSPKHPAHADSNGSTKSLQLEDIILKDEYRSRLCSLVKKRLRRGVEYKRSFYRYKLTLRYWDIKLIWHIGDSGNPKMSDRARRRLLKLRLVEEVADRWMQKRLVLTDKGKAVRRAIRNSARQILKKMRDKQVIEIEHSSR